MKKSSLLIFLFCWSVLMVNAQLTDVITGLNFPYDLAIDANELYISENRADRLIKIDVDVPTPPAIQEVLSGLAEPAGLYLQGTELYYTEFDTKAVFKIDIASANPVPTLITDTGLGFPSRLLIEENYLYITDQDLDQLLRWDLAAADPVLEVVADGFNNPTAMAKFGDDIYLTEFGFGETASTIKKVDTGQSPAVVTTVTEEVIGASGLTRNGSFLYIAEDDRISRLDLNAETPVLEELVTGLSGSRAIVFSGMDLYIAQVGTAGPTDGKIAKLLISTPVFANLPSVCLGDTAAVFGGASPTGGVYSGPGVVDNGDGSTFDFDQAVAGGVGTYTISYSYAGSTVTTALSVVVLPEVNFTTGMLSIEEDEGIQTGLGGGLPTGGVYSGSGVIDDGNGMTYSFDPDVSGPGNIEVTYTFTVGNGCNDSARDSITVIAVVNVTNLANTALKIFPNPTTGHIQLPPLALERVAVYDATGRLVVNQLQPSTSIDLGAQPAGLYILKMYAGEEVYSAKVVKE